MHEAKANNRMRRGIQRIQGIYTGSRLQRVQLQRIISVCVPIETMLTIDFDVWHKEMQTLRVTYCSLCSLGQDFGRFPADCRSTNSTILCRKSSISRSPVYCSPLSTPSIAFASKSYNENNAFSMNSIHWVLLTTFCPCPPSVNKHVSSLQRVRLLRAPICTSRYFSQKGTVLFDINV